MTKTVIVTGGTGYVAGWCIVELLRRGYVVRATVRSLSKEQAVRASISSAVDPGDHLHFVAANLTSDAGWGTAVAGGDYVLHVASPLGDNNPNDPDALIIPARDGALRVLRAATEAGVKRVVMTSACAAASPPLYSQDGVTDESLWTDPNDTQLSAYRKSKTLAELAAWQFMKDYAGPTTLATILPGAVFGPVLSAGNVGTARVIGRLLQGRMPGIPRLAFEVVDVRDLADVHIRAMTAEQAGGQRFIAVSEFMWMKDIAQVLRARLGSSAHKVPTRTLPDFVLRFLARFDPEIRAIAPGLGRKNRHTSEKARRLLGWHPRPAAETVIDCAKSLIASNAV
jgi:dihydroflavonol-4-reductase